MRKIVAILIVAIIVFWMAYGLFEPWRNTVNNFMLKVAGPTVTAWIVGIGTSPFWMQYGSFIMLGAGFIVGMFVYRLWYSGKWRIRKWGISGAAKDMGAVGVSNIPATPVTQTPVTRPAQKTTAKETTPIVTPTSALPETKEEET